MQRDSKKPALRKTLLERRDGLSHDMIMLCERQIRRHISKIPGYRDAQTIGCYFAEGSEVPTRQIILEARSAGRLVCLPRVSNGALEFAAVEGPGDLVEGSLGIMEPHARCDPCPAPDVLLVPAVGVSHNGARLGRGGGHYDRFLDAYSGISVALAFTVQLVHNIPEQDWDRRVSWVVTEDGATRASRER